MPDGSELPDGVVKLKLDATGHAVDAANYYNDAVGSAGGSCAPR